TALQLRVAPTWTTISSCSCRRSSPDWGAQSRRDAFFIPFLALRTAGRNFTADRRSLGLSRLCRQAPGRISHIWRSPGAFRRARASRCRQPDGRLRDRGRRDAPRRRVVLGWARPHPGADGCLCGPDGGTGGAVLHPGSASVGHDRLSEYGGCPRCRQRRNLRLVGKVAPASKGGSVTGLVGAAGGLGGFLPPLVMGYIYGRTGSYGWGLALLALVAAGTMVFTMTVVRSAALARAREAGRLPNTRTRRTPKQGASPGV